ncbi:TspO/MBR family protein [Sphingomonas sp. TREG-RG-20F-R18-01]|uniref:TspO/MBR family protein n=1 Tax=Sphingomonas sp. TREG-RG-20F-R18-01 TaxID=2914982 RepID=UPI001F586C02|nr:TspO/MBR family protein [Sphingomonas sp. TREG-RG-20F-R18-01]
MRDMATNGTGSIASRGQLRAGFLRWLGVTVPLMLLLGFGVAQFVPAGKDNVWYSALTKPALNPPDWAFPVAWSLLYVLLGVVLAMVLNARGARLRTPALIVFFLQLAVNLSWSPLFFGLHQVVVALVVIGLMVGLTMLMSILFSQVRGLAAVLLLPYLAWLLFAAYLNYEILALNPGVESLAPGAKTTQISPR